MLAQAMALLYESTTATITTAEREAAIAFIFWRWQEMKQHSRK
jgi:hypothetical protein